ncbi:MAG: PAS domain S-box protein [Sulfurimonas sp.]
MGVANAEQVEQALQEWVSALDVLDDAVFIHDQECRILRCNRTYQRLADLPFKEIIGQPYYKIFPKSEKPLAHCLTTIDDPNSTENEDDIVVDDTLYRSRSFAIRNEKGDFHYSIHILQDITREHADEEKLKENEMFIKTVLENLPIGIAVNTTCPQIKFSYMNDNFPKLYRTTRKALNTPDKFWEEVYKDTDFCKKIKKQITEDVESGDLSRMHWDNIPITRKGEETTYISAQNIPLPHMDSMISMVWDVTERKKGEDLLRNEKQFSDKLIESIPDIFFLINDKAKLERWNKELENVFDLTPEELQDRDALAFIHTADRSKITQAIEETFKVGYSTVEARLMTKSGSRYYKLTSKVITTPKGKGIIGIGLDMTERKEAEMQVQKERDFSDKLFETAPVIILILDPKGKIVRYNRYMEQLCGYPLKEMKGQEWFAHFLPKETQEKTKEVFLEAINDMDTQGTIDTMLTRSGEMLQIEWYSKTIKKSDGTTEGLLTIGMDVTKRQKTEEHLKESEEKFRTMTTSAQDAILMLDADGDISYWNESAERIFGYSEDEALGKNLHNLLAPERFHDAHHKAFAEFLQTGKGAAVGKTVELAALKKDGTEFPIELSMSAIRRKDTWGALGIIRDISERKDAEIALSRANRALKTLSAGNLALVHANSEEELLNEVTKVIVEVGGYSLASVDYADDGPDKPLIPIAWSGFEGKEYWLHDLCWKETEQGVLPAGAAIREKRAQIYQDISDPSTCPIWREASMERGYTSHIALPLFDGEKAFGVLSIYSSREESFDKEEIHLLEELANDLAYGILNQRTRASNKKHEALMREGLEQTILAMSATVESRDPYTAGHQKRVAELATAIAEEIGLDPEETEGIRFAAIIHDLGKIHIPAEILSKPGKLTDIEYKLIQTHSQEGYEIIKDVHFPWPIAQYILQHHERLDGSGYPQGLKGDEILLGAKIITVADVIEAISSHRPYRSALGFEVALEEITKGRGKYYDAEVVDACLNLFNEKNFRFGTEFH